MVPRTRTDLGQHAAQRHQLEQHCAVAGMEPCSWLCCASRKNVNRESTKLNRTHRVAYENLIPYRRTGQQGRRRVNLLSPRNGSQTHQQGARLRAGGGDGAGFVIGRLA